MARKAEVEIGKTDRADWLVRLMDEISEGPEDDPQLCADMMFVTTYMFMHSNFTLLDQNDAMRKCYEMLSTWKVAA